MRGWLAKRRGEVAGVLVFVAIRVITVWGRPIERFGDSEGYFELDWSGDGTRFWPVPLLYTVISSDAARVVAHVALSCVAWIVLAAGIRRLVPLLRWTGPALTLLLGSTPQVARWDLTILSESIGLSIAVACVGCWLHVTAAPRSIGWWCGATITTILFGMTRPTQVPIQALLVPMIAWSTSTR